MNEFGGFGIATRCCFFDSNDDIVDGDSVCATSGPAGCTGNNGLSPLATDCPFQSTLYDAARECRAQGEVRGLTGRVCTKEQLLAEACGSGCNIDFRHVWTTTPCPSRPRRRRRRRRRCRR